MRARLAATGSVARGHPVHLGAGNPFQEDDELESTFFESKRLVGVDESDAAGVDACNKATVTRLPKKSVRMRNHEKTATHLGPDLHRPVLLSKSPLIFVFGSIERAQHRLGDAKELQQGRRTRGRRGQSRVCHTFVILPSRDELGVRHAWPGTPVLEKDREQFSATPETL